MLLCEANQPPQEVVEYLGDGDEFHMAFNFPVMPRIFMALRSDATRCGDHRADAAYPARYDLVHPATTTSLRWRW